MASEIAGLFTTPEQYQLAQDQAQQAQAIQFAQLDPRAQAQYGFYRGGQQLGSAIGGALGGEDPQLKMISQRQQLASQLDPSKPESFMQAAQLAAQSGDQQFAIALANSGRQAAIQVAQANKERQLAVPADIQKAQMIPQIDDAIDKYMAMPPSPERDRAIKMLENQKKILIGDKTSNIAAPLQVASRISEITKLQTNLPVDSQEYKLLNAEKIQLQKSEKTEATPAKIQEAERVAKSKGFTAGTSEFETQVANYLQRPEKDTQIEMLQTYRDQLIKANAPQSKLDEVNAVIKSVGEGSAPKILLPGQPAAPKDWLAFSSQISKDPVMDRTSTIISDAPNAIETIRMSTSNDIAAASLPGALARLTGEGKNMSDRDISRYASTGGLDDRVAQDVVGFFTGRKTTVTKEQAERFATAVYRGALLERKKFIKDQAEQAGYDKTPNYDIAIRQLDDQLAKFKLVKPGEKNKPQSSEATSTFDADKEKRYQEFKAKQSGVTR